MTKRRFGDNKKVEILGRIFQLGFKVLPVPESLVFKAAGKGGVKVERVAV
jgi:ribonuclease VapC